MQVLEENQTNDDFSISYEKIIFVNESIKKIQSLSFKIRLRALNSLISARKGFHMGSQGFSAVAFELIDFSNLLEEQSQKLNISMNQILLDSTEERKLKRRAMLHHKAMIQSHSLKSQIEANGRNTENNLHFIFNWKKNISAEIEILNKILRDTLKICKKGRFIMMCIKIESAYIQNDKEIYRQLSSDVSNALEDTERILKEVIVSLFV